VLNRFKRTATAVCAITVVVAVAPTPAYADAVRDRQWHLHSLKVAKANGISRGDGVVVAVVDTGVDPHPDLRSNLLEGGSVLASRPDNGQGDQNGHGTLMASLIAATGRKGGDGVVGIAPSAKILPVRDSDAQGRGNSVRAAEAIAWATSHQAQIINFSRAVSPSIALQKAVKDAIASDILVVAAAGNKDQDAVAAYPAEMDGVLAVGASDRSGNPAGFSRPSKQVSICAHGVDIVGAEPNGRYSIGEGTSQATAIGSGAAALVRSKFPDLSAPDVIHRLTATADDVGAPGRDDECGYGVLNIVKALTAEVPPLSGTSASPSSAPTPTDERGEAAAPKGSKMPLVLGGVAAAVAVVVALLVVRRRKRA